MLAIDGRRGSVLAACAAVVTAVVSFVSVPAIDVPCLDTGAVGKPPRLALAGRSSTNEDDLDSMRMDALQGNVDASAYLVGRLLDRYEHGGTGEDLFEAVHWIARDWDQGPFVRSDVVHRVVTQHCAVPVMKWHWLCVLGE